MPNNSASALYHSDGMISPYLSDTGITAKQSLLYQEYLANTAHQREVSDLKAAGINPVLTAGTSGASVPSGDTDDAETIAFLQGVKAAQGHSSAKATEAGIDFVANTLGLVGGARLGKWFKSAVGLVSQLAEENPDAARIATAKQNGSYMAEYEKKHGYEPGTGNQHAWENIKGFFRKLFS